MASTGFDGDLVLPETLDEFMQKPTHKTVTVMRPSGPVEINVAIEYNLPEHKPFLGGFKNRNTGVEYHNVAGQTALLPHQRGLEKLVDRFHRATQTQITESADSQTARESGLQTPFYHQFIKEEYTILQAQPYTLAEDELQARELAALSIQRVTRGFFAKQTVGKMRKELEEEKVAIEQQEREVQEELEHKRILAIERRRHPRTAADFKVLHEELKAWHYQETVAINEGDYTEEEKHKLLVELLKKETELIHTIDQMKIEARKLNREEKIQSDLDSISKKKLWQLTNGEVIKVRTPNSMRAKELRNLYMGLKIEDITADERIELLLMVKQTVKEFKCQLTQDLITLIDREADLLNRGRPKDSLAGLRKRIESLFLQFIMTPEFNPDAEQLQKTPQVVTSD